MHSSAPRHPIAATAAAILYSEAVFWRFLVFFEPCSRLLSVPRWTRNSLCNGRKSPSRPKGEYATCGRERFSCVKREPRPVAEACGFCHNHTGHYSYSTAAIALCPIRPPSTARAAQWVANRPYSYSLSGHRQRQPSGLSCAALPGPGSVCPAKAIYGLAALHKTTSVHLLGSTRMICALKSAFYGERIESRCFSFFSSGQQASATTVTAAAAASSSIHLNVMIFHSSTLPSNLRKHTLTVL